MVVELKGYNILEVVQVNALQHESLSYTFKENIISMLCGYVRTKLITEILDTSVKLRKGKQKLSEVFENLLTIEKLSTITLSLT